MARRPESLNGVPVPYAASVAELRTRLRPPSPEAWAAVVALANSDSPEAVDVLVGLTYDPDWRYRRVAVEALGSHPLDRRATRAVLCALRDSSPYVVRTACEAAADMQLAEAHAPVARLLESKSGLTRQTAVAALARVWSAEDLPALVRLYRCDPAKKVRREAAWTLWKNVSAETWRPLFDLWLNDPLHRHRVWACLLAGAFGDPAAKAQLVPLCRDPDGHVRKAARRALEGP
jgi:HEAT repeat protein